MNYQTAFNKCRTFGQEHLLKYYDELNESQKEELVSQILATDFSVIKQAQNQEKKGVISPIEAMEIDEITKMKQEYEAFGLEQIKMGKVAAVLLAGGMGTRLGSDAPKGMYDIGLTKEVYIFERLIENLMDVVKKADTWIHLFVMTSDKNHEMTMEFFEEKDFVL